MTGPDSLLTPIGAVERLQSAINAHDLDALVDCFAPDFVNETPAHPERGFAGSDQVRRNWGQVLGAVPGLTSRLLSASSDGDTVWTEWEWSGRRVDGQPHLMRGVTISEVRRGQITRVRFYMEPVIRDGLDIESSVRRTLGARIEVPAR